MRIFYIIKSKWLKGNNWIESNRKEYELLHPYTLINSKATYSFYLAISQVIFTQIKAKVKWNLRSRVGFGQFLKTKSFSVHWNSTKWEYIHLRVLWQNFFTTLFQALFLAVRQRIKHQENYAKKKGMERHD